MMSSGPQFEYGFLGKGVQMFNRYLDKHFLNVLDESKGTKRDGYYNREILLIQSSGSGKSRLITEFTKTNLGILLNLRKPEGSSLLHPSQVLLVLDEVM